MKILVCGGRNYMNAQRVSDELDALSLKHNIDCIVHGDARGADRLADAWGKLSGIERKPYPAEWDKHGLRAGPIRNIRMLDENPDIELVVVFPGGRGTEHMKRIARERGVRVHEVEDKE